MILGQGVCKLYFPVSQMASCSVLPTEVNKRRSESKAREKKKKKRHLFVLLFLFEADYFNLHLRALPEPALWYLLAGFRSSHLGSSFLRSKEQWWGSSFNLLGPDSFITYPQSLGLGLGTSSWIISNLVTAMFLFCSITFKYPFTNFLFKYPYSKHLVWFLFSWWLQCQGQRVIPSNLKDRIMELF